ncbi:MAG: selenocysteine-specific translation elongation factor, partial [Actinobacteria bacterium]
MRIIATAGHVDHGKSSLVQALTGTDPDRWEEEKRRGLTIDLGFAFTQLSNNEIGFIDVPGHVRFLRNMLAGVGGIDACMFVVAANEGWKPQTEEHLRILDALGITRGIIVLTKTDLIDDEALALAFESVHQRVRSTFLEHAPVVCVSIHNPSTLDILRGAITELVIALPPQSDTHRPRIWVDRAFAAKGSGTVITGTLTGSSLRVGDELVSLPNQHTVKIRGIQSNGISLDKLEAGNRCALNLTGIDHLEINRGDVLVIDGQWLGTNKFDASLNVLAAIEHAVSKRGSYMMYIGSREIPVALHTIGSTSIHSGKSGCIRVTLPVILPIAPGDRFILRESGRDETIGGGQVLDIQPIMRTSKATPNSDVLRLVAERGWVQLSQLHLLAGRIVDISEVEQVLDGWVTTHHAFDQVSQELSAHITASKDLGVDVATLSLQQRLVLPTVPNITVRDGRARSVDANDIALHPMVQQFADAGCMPPDAASLDKSIVRQLVQRGVLVHCDELYFHSSALEKAIASAR